MLGKGSGQGWSAAAGATPGSREWSRPTWSGSNPDPKPNPNPNPNPTPTPIQVARELLRLLGVAEPPAYEPSRDPFAAQATHTHIHTRYFGKRAYLAGATTYRRCNIGARQQVTT